MPRYNEFCWQSALKQLTTNISRPLKLLEKVFQQAPIPLTLILKKSKLHSERYCNWSFMYVVQPTVHNIFLFTKNNSTEARQQLFVSVIAMGTWVKYVRNIISDYRVIWYIDRFQPNGDTPPVIVYNYYKSIKNYVITYPKLPLLIVGSKGALVPMEVSLIDLSVKNTRPFRRIVFSFFNFHAFAEVFHNKQPSITA